MAEWWLYGPRDLLLFAPRTYYRLFELYNLELWPLQLLALALGTTVLVLWRRGGARAGRAIAAILLLCWLWVAWGFHWQRYASINLAAGYFALAFVAQALLLLWLGVLRGRLAPAPATRLQQRAGLILVLFALLGFPLLGPLLGRSWTQAEVFGMAPDPTALATLGVLLLAGGRPAWGLWPLPVAWCLVSGTTLWAMEAPDFALAPLAALLAVGLAAGGAARRSR
ncbi:hypothetical protein SAMN05216201_11851 [Pseudomonas linyingensis]|uniref:MFS transporter permease n=1 Tax=Pseudomonas linyingensis TaxID=915471 RepID=A0A1H7C167_9PSED|nr:DUF6064 family protein [Pseudomonas linyingensis]SEJ79355.1 hypothetical protein SAMN05216201_11851 [Pseudomonas linyingensis]